MSVLSDRLLAVHDALSGARLPHAFGGAIALAYCTYEPRGTRDLDVNAFVPPARANDVLDALPAGVTVRSIDRRRAHREGQVRVLWDETPIDLFLSSHPFHDEAEAAIRAVPFDGTTIPVLGCEALVVFKALFNRTRDWADIEAVLAAGAIHAPRVLERLRALLGAADPAVVRFGALTES